jgi:hypothetical protein
MVLFTEGRKEREGERGREGLCKRAAHSTSRHGTLLDVVGWMDLSEGWS